MSYLPLTAAAQQFPVVGTTVNANTTLTWNGMVTTGIAIASHLNMRLNGQALPEGLKFKKSLELFLVDMQLNEIEQNHFHYLVWIELFGSSYQDFGTVLRNNMGIVPAFGSEQTRKHFVKWLTEYEKIFYQNRQLEHTYVPLPISGDIRGMWVEDNDPHTLSTTSLAILLENLINDWVWIVSHCHKPVIRMSNGWLFESDAEALIFKMR